MDASSWAVLVWNADVIHLMTIGLLYLFAGRQTFWLVMLLDPEGEDCTVTKAVADGSFPRLLYVGFLVFWPILLLVGWVMADRSKPGATGCKK